jgi:uncharacterized protein (TIGR01777 family)
MYMAKVIITGGSGLVGKRLTEMLAKKGYGVNILTRKPGNANEYKWDLQKNIIDEKVFEDVEAIIHLAGVGIAENRWTEERKKEIVESRTRSIELLYDHLSTHENIVRYFISASAVGFYGDRGAEVLTEEASNGTGFLAEVCRQWEDAADKMRALNIEVSKTRTGIVLSKHGGALEKLDLPVKFGVGTYMGDGKQFVSWIHLDDLCRMYIYLLEKKSDGIYNGCAPEAITNKQMTLAIAKAMHRPVLPIPVPAIALKLALGEMSSMLLMSDNCSSDKILSAGFEFQFPTIGAALADIYH